MGEESSARSTSASQLTQLWKLSTVHLTTPNCQTSGLWKSYSLSCSTRPCSSTIPTWGSCWKTKWRVIGFSGPKSETRSHPVRHIFEPDITLRMTLDRVITHEWVKACRDRVSVSKYDRFIRHFTHFQDWRLLEVTRMHDEDHVPKTPEWIPSPFDSNSSTKLSTHDEDHVNHSEFLLLRSKFIHETFQIKRCRNTWGSRRLLKITLQLLQRLHRGRHTPLQSACVPAPKSSRAFPESKTSRNYLHARWRDKDYVLKTPQWISSRFDQNSSTEERYQIKWCRNTLRSESTLENYSFIHIQIDILLHVLQQTSTRNVHVTILQRYFVIDTRK